MDDKYYDEDGNILKSIQHMENYEFVLGLDIIPMFLFLRVLYIDRYSRPIFKIYQGIDEFLHKLNRNIQHKFMLTYMYIGTLTNTMICILPLTLFWISISWEI